MDERGSTNPRLIDRLTQLCVGPGVACDPVGELQNLVFTLVTTAAIVVVPLYSAFFVYQGQLVQGLATFALMLLLVFNVVLNGRRGRVEWALKLHVSCMLANTCFMVFLEAGVGPSSWWLILPAYVLVGSGIYRWAIVQLVAALAFELCVLKARSLGMLVASAPGQNADLLTYMARVGLFVALLATLYFTTYQRNETLRKLMRANQLALDATNAKSQFLANMSHEIRTPMNGVLGMAELLLGTPLTEKQQHFTGTIYRSGESLLKIINSILDFSKIESEKFELESVVFDLRVLVGETIEFVAAAMQKPLVVLRYDFDSAIPVGEFKGDPNRLRQILTNLVGNALKFTEHGEVVVEAHLVTAHDVEVFEAGDAVSKFCQLRFSVRDTGIGIAASKQTKLFEAFVQADSSMTRKFGGTGLGLAIAKQLAERMGGTMGCESVVGQGSTFWFTVNLQCGLIAQSVIAGPSPIAHPMPPLQASIILHGRRRVLLAEDNLVNQELGRAMLEGLGCLVEVVGTGREAIKAVEAQHFDLILMDCHMPDMDGFEATARLLERKKELQVPSIIAMTAGALEKSRERCLAAGMDDYLSKPYTQAQLCSVLERWPMKVLQTHAAY